MKKQDSLNTDFLENPTRKCRIGRSVIIYKSTASTNDIAWQYSLNNNNDGLAVFAELQTQGRGRRASKWHSSEGSSILCSVLLKDEKISSETLNLASSIAVAEAIGDCANNQPIIKWPNDIYINNKKIAGILIEAKKNDYVIGVGINCHQSHQDFPNEIIETATSIDIETGSFCDRNFIAKRLLISLDEWITTAKKNLNDVILCRWRQLCPQIGKPISIVHNNSVFSGFCKDIDPQKGIVLVLNNGAVRMFDASNSSILKSSI